MTIAHLSHYGITKVGQSEDNVVLCGTLAACKRMAAAHGMEIDRYEGRILGIDGNRAAYAPVDEKRPQTIWFKGSGLIQKGRDDYTLVMPLELWSERV